MPCGWKQPPLVEVYLALQATEEGAALSVDAIARAAGVSPADGYHAVILLTGDECLIIDGIESGERAAARLVDDAVRIFGRDEGNGFKSMPGWLSALAAACGTYRLPGPDDVARVENADAQAVLLRQLPAGLEV
jgi:hypothetical protein